MDLLRLATGGSGVLSPGAIHPDLVGRLAREAKKSAAHVLEICIRALDYCPPVDITFADYLLPMSTDVPSCNIIHVETPNPLNPLGVKGAGEGGTIGAIAAVVSAVEDALSPFGVRFLDTPLTPERIVAALQAAGAYEKLAAA